MANSHAHSQQSEEKKHGDALDNAVEPRDDHEQSGSIPAPDNGGHARSQAAHLGGAAHDHTKPAGDLRRYEQEREPPMEVTRAGKDHRRQ